MLWRVCFDECNHSKISEPIRSGSQTIGPEEPTGDTPSVSHSLDSSLRKGAGVGLCHSTGRPETATLRAIFIAPTKLKSFYISPFNGGHSLSLAFARQLPQGGSRGRVRGLVPFNRVLAKPEGCGRFSSPLRNSECFTFHHSSGNGVPFHRPCNRTSFQPSRIIWLMASMRSTVWVRVT